MTVAAHVGRRRTQVFLKESVVLFGFLNGLFVGIGVNPAATILGVVEESLVSLAGGNGYVQLALTLLPLILLAFALYMIWRRGGWLGFVAVACAFLAGLWLLAAPVTATVMLAASFLLGYIATR